MKHFFIILTLAIITGCGHSGQKHESSQDFLPDIEPQVVDDIKEHPHVQKPKEVKPADNSDSHSQTLKHEFKSAKYYKLTDTITADFNGDGYSDQAIFQREMETSGVTIRHGQTNEEVEIGFGEQFAHLTDFNWVDFWGLVNDSTTYEILIKDAKILGDRKVKLINPSIVVRKEELGGGLITFKNGKYEWIHQAH